MFRIPIGSWHVNSIRMLIGFLEKKAWKHRKLVAKVNERRYPVTCLSSFMWDALEPPKYVRESTSPTVAPTFKTSQASTSLFSRALFSTSSKYSKKTFLQLHALLSFSVENASFIHRFINSIENLSFLRNQLNLCISVENKISNSIKLMTIFIDNAPNCSWRFRIYLNFESIRIFIHLFPWFRVDWSW